MHSSSLGLQTHVLLALFFYQPTPQREVPPCQTANPFTCPLSLTSGEWWASYITVFVMVVLTCAFDFWTVKNVTGRVMVALRCAVWTSSLRACLVPMHTTTAPHAQRTERRRGGQRLASGGTGQLGHRHRHTYNGSTGGHTIVWCGMVWYGMVRYVVVVVVVVVEALSTCRREKLPDTLSPGRAQGSSRPALRWPGGRRRRPRGGGGSAFCPGGEGGRASLGEGLPVCVTHVPSPAAGGGLVHL